LAHRVLPALDRRQRTSRITGNPAVASICSGKQGQCGQCHLVNGRGKRMGPDHSDRNAPEAQSICASRGESGRDLTPGYQTITVVTKDGKRIVGAQRSYDDFSWQLMDASTNYYSSKRVT